MATDVRKHEAPAPLENPKRAAINALSESINDFIVVANTTERAQLASDLAPITATRPLLVFRQDAPDDAQFEYTVDGTNWRKVGAQRQGGTITRTTPGDANITGTADVVLATGSVGSVAPGLYLVTGRACLYTPSGGVNGNLLLIVNGNTVLTRYDINTGGAFPISAYSSLYYSHTGGALTIGVGYRRSNTTNTLTVTGSSGVTSVEAQRIAL